MLETTGNKPFPFLPKLSATNCWYHEKKLSNIIDNIFQEKILYKDGVIIVHRHKKENDEFSEKFRILDEKKYGISKIIFGDLN